MTRYAVGLGSIPCSFNTSSTAESVLANWNQINLESKLKGYICLILELRVRLKTDLIQLVLQLYVHFNSKLQKFLSIFILIKIRLRNLLDS